MSYKLKDGTKMPQIKPCPCCGNKNLYAGKLNAAKVGICCLKDLGGCGLELGIDYDDLDVIQKENVPAEEISSEHEFGIDEFFEAINGAYFYAAIQKWNKRMQ